MSFPKAALIDHQKARAPHQPCTIVIFGVTGDLTARKLIPALYNLQLDSLLPINFNCIGVARRPFSDEEIRATLKKAAREFSRSQPLQDAVWSEFEKKISYQTILFEEDEGYLCLKKRLQELESDCKENANRVFYLSTAPSFFPTIIEKLRAHDLIYDARLPGPWSKVIIEKPFGQDLESALHLQTHVEQHLDESQIYRIDHYLGKETVQNMLVFRFGNHIFESLWNNQHIDNVQITMSEDLGIGRRGVFYEEAGQLRDIVQNHMMQLLALLAMEPPASLQGDAIRNEKVKVLESIRPLSPEKIDDFAIRGQYGPGLIAENKVVGYRQEQNVDPQSKVETFVALKLHIDNWRWSGVPFFLRTGKRLPKRTTEIAVSFKSVPGILFQSSNPKSNVLTMRIQPDEGIVLSLNCKVPGMTGQIQHVGMNFSYNDYFKTASPEAYERLLCDCFLGDSALFARKDEVVQSWRLLAPIIERWKDVPSDFPNYSAGSWGPLAADDLLAKTNHVWVKLDRRQ